MKHAHAKDRRLESFRLFPYVAWILTALFTFFVYQITVELREVSANLELQSEFIEEQVKKQPENIKDFTPPSQAAVKQSE
jgi:hypothetical protein